MKQQLLKGFLTSLNLHRKKNKSTCLISNTTATKTGARKPVKATATAKQSESATGSNVQVKVSHKPTNLNAKPHLHETRNPLTPTPRRLEPRNF